MSLGGIGIPTVLLLVQLIVGLVAVGDVVRAVARHRLTPFVAGPLLVAVLLLTLALDGLWLGIDVIGRIVYETGIDPGLARPGLIVLILIGMLLWMRDN